MTQVGDRTTGREHSLREVGEAHVLHVHGGRREAVDVHRQVQLQHKRDTRITSNAKVTNVGAYNIGGGGGGVGGGDGDSGGGGAGGGANANASVNANANVSGSGAGGGAKARPRAAQGSRPPRTRGPGGRPARTHGGGRPPRNRGISHTPRTPRTPHSPHSTGDPESHQRKRVGSARNRKSQGNRVPRSKTAGRRVEGAKKPPRTKATPRRIRYRCENNSTIGDVLRDRGWTQVGENDDSWQLNWCDVTCVRATLDRRLTGNQLIPHFRNHYELTRKNLLARNLKRLKRFYHRSGLFKEAELCDCMPVTFELPVRRTSDRTSQSVLSEYLMFVEEYRRRPGATWIVKPVTGCQGRGIFLFQRLKELVEWRARREAEVAAAEAAAKAAAAATGGPSPVDTSSGGSGDDQGESSGGSGGGGGGGGGSGGGSAETHAQVYVVQRYVERPYMVAGRKFDMRLYVLVTSFHPLKAWLAREGFARISMERFSLAILRDQRVHLTNMAVQMRAKSDAIQRGCKWSMRRLREYLTARHGVTAVDALLQRITRVVITSLQSVRNVITQDKHCFELYGYDILLDQDLRPWLLEVNASPSLAATDPADYRLKYRLLMDTLNVLDLEHRLTGRERRVGGFDLIWDAGPVPMGSPGAGRDGCCEAPVPLPDGDGSVPRRLNAYLGCCNERERQLEVVWHDAACVRANCRRTPRDLSPPSESFDIPLPACAAFTEESANAI